MSTSSLGFDGFWTVSYSCTTVEYVEGEIGTKFGLDGCIYNVTYIHEQAKVCYCRSELCNKPVPSDYIDPDPELTNSATVLSLGASMKIYLCASVLLLYTNFQRV